MNDDDTAESERPREQVSRWTRVLGWLRYANNILLLPMFTLLVLESMQTRSIDTFDSINHFFCAMFLSEWLLGLSLADNRVLYLRRPENIADLVSSIPFTAFAQSLRVIRLLRLFRIARVAMRLRRFKGKSARAVRAFGLVAALVLTGALAFRIVEPDSTNGLEDALWWSLVTLSTVGYGDITPTTPGGHMVSAFVIFAGVGVFGYMAGFMTTILEDPEEDEILDTVRRLEHELTAMRATLERALPSAAQSDGPQHTDA
ncbi:potassium channel family protein [Enhygromyxa salina]|uniref:Cyclic nucleotide-gated potassium channel n=1 Tax=Enhygromyxa salina TaxID=215803 RepID=A0A2S9YDS3_9BACT|nr:ion transporter [Enhygromyxa salina]PRQ03161.1 Cyclic nucleotide-gated potassium channel [Enhygromyxa salina]